MFLESNTVILFRFHDSVALCRERLHLIRHFNPRLPIFGLFGGSPHDLRRAEVLLGDLFTSLYVVSRRTARWKWLHQDLMVAEWFREVGRHVPFTHLVDCEYDLLLVGKLDTLLPQVNQRQVALSGVRLLIDVRDQWYWTSVRPFKQHFDRYQEYLRDTYDLTPQTYVSQGPFPLLSRSFLEAFAESPTPPPSILSGINCEVTYPAIAEALGFQIIDTGLHPHWTPSPTGSLSSPLFHCEATPQVSSDGILQELARPAGRRTFHPVKTNILAATLINAVRTTSGARVNPPSEHDRSER